MDMENFKIKAVG